MDYFLQRQITSNGLNPNFTRTNVRLPATPANNFITPGIGQITKLYSFYVPTHTQRAVHSINKEIHSKLNQEGSGNSEEESSMR
jgi:hypothetical protein